LSSIFKIKINFSPALYANIDFILDVLKLRSREARAWCAMPLSALVALNKVSFVVFVALNTVANVLFEIF
jgi:hypothetical protein